MTIQGIFHVLKPEYEVTRDHTESGESFWKIAKWKFLGTARDMADAKSKFGGAPILYWCCPGDPEWIEEAKELRI